VKKKGIWYRVKKKKTRGKSPGENRIERQQVRKRGGGKRNQGKGEGKDWESELAGTRDWGKSKVLRPLKKTPKKKLGKKRSGCTERRKKTKGGSQKEGVRSDWSLVQKNQVPVVQVQEKRTQIKKIVRIHPHTWVTWGGRRVHRRSLKKGETWDSLLLRERTREKGVRVVH